MSRIGYIEFPRAQYPYGRLVCEASYDSAECVMFFIVPSRGHANIVHGISVDAKTTEVVCGCEWAQCHTQARKALDLYGTPLERQFFETMGKRLYPSILRHPNGLCAHAKLVRKWIQRHKLLPAMRTVEGVMLGRLTEMRQAC